jgi:hypothetical protein
VLPAPFALSPAFEPLTLEEVNEAQRQMGVGAVRVMIQQSAATGHSLQPPSGLPQGVDPSQPELRQGAGQALGSIKEGEGPVELARCDSLFGLRKETLRLGRWVGQGGRLCHRLWGLRRVIGRVRHQSVASQQKVG